MIQPISDRATFAHLRRSRRRVRRGPVTVTWVEGEPSEPTRVAYTVGRRVGGAVVRNRVRRRLRAATSEAGGLLRPGPYLIGARPEAAQASYGELRTAVNEALRAVTRTPAPPRTAMPT
ncbi:MAG: ribonuclease P protein component [Acidimicrobiales bacterium]